MTSSKLSRIRQYYANACMHACSYMFAFSTEMPSSQTFHQNTILSTLLFTCRSTPWKNQFQGKWKIIVQLWVWWKWNERVSCCLRMLGKGFFSLSLTLTRWSYLYHLGLCCLFELLLCVVLWGAPCFPKTWCNGFKLRLTRFIHMHTIINNDFICLSGTFRSSNESFGALAHTNAYELHIWNLVWHQSQQFLAKKQHIFPCPPPGNRSPSKEGEEKKYI